MPRVPGKTPTTSGGHFISVVFFVKNSRRYLRAKIVKIECGLTKLL